MSSTRYKVWGHTLPQALKSSKARMLFLYQLVPATPASPRGQSLVPSAAVLDGDVYLHPNSCFLLFPPILSSQATKCMPKSLCPSKHCVSVQLLVLALKSLHHMLVCLCTVVHLLSPVGKHTQVKPALILVNKSQLRQEDQKLIQTSHKVLRINSYLTGQRIKINNPSYVMSQKSKATRHRDFG